MGTGDYICVTVHGCAPWGFTLREGVGDSYRPLQVYQVVEGGRASIAGICEGDEVVSLNGEPCSDLSLPEAIALVEATVNCLQLLVKRCCSLTPQFDPGKTFSGVKDTSGEALESQTLHILSPGGSGPTGEYYTGDSQDEDYSGNAESDADSSQRAGDTVRTELCVPASGACRFTGAGRSGDQAGPRTGSFPPGAMVELQLSISKHTPEDPNSTSLGSALGIEGEIQAREAFQNRALLHTTTHSLYVPGPIREPLGQHGVVLSSPSLNGTVEVTMQHPAAGRGSPRLAEGAGVCENVTDAPGDEGGGRGQGAHASFTVSFGIPTEGLSPEEEQDSDSGEDVGRPSKHRARHARLRRSESLSDKQVKEAKSKCKRIAILLNTDAPNPHNKGLLMFKKHRQRSKKYTLVSYGTGESDPEREDDDSDEEDENTNKDARAIDFNLVAPTGKSALDKDVIPNAQGGSRVLTFDWDTGLLEIERKLATGDTMEQLPNTTGKGATMFAQRRQRMDEIAAEHEEMRRQGIPVEGVQAVEKHAAYQQMGERSYMQATMESQTYMDVNVHQKQQHEYQQYQEQQQYQQQYQQQQQQQYEQLHYQQQQQFQQQYQQQQQHQHQEYQQQQTRQYSSNMNGTVNHQTTEMQSSVSNQTAQPFSMEKQMSGAFSSLVIGSNQEAMGQGEQIASRDERISTPAIKSGILHDTRNRTKGKPMFNFKQAPKVSPNPELLNLLNRSDKKLDVESGTEEDYLSLGAEACNFLQSSKVKQKTPPPVAPKPVINPNSPPWSPQPELSNQELPQRAENSVPAAPAAAPESESVPAPELASEPSPPLAPQEAPVPANPPITDEPTWSSLGSQAHQRPQQEPSWGGNGPPPEPDLQPEPQAWTQDQAQAQPQPSWISSPQPQPPTNAWTSPQSQAQPAQPMQSQPPAHPQPLMNAWGTAPAQAQVQPPWAQKHQEQTQPPTNTWAPDQNQPRPQPPWSQPSATQSQTQQNWQQPRPQQAPQAWSPANAQPQTHTSTWGPSAQQAPVNTQNQSRVSQPSPQTWNAPQSAPHSTPPPQRMNSYTFGERSSSSPVNPMASVLSLAGGMGSALSMPAVRGKGADLFAKRQSRMEKYVVDSDTVQAATAAHQAQAAMAQATKARPASPSPSVPNSWKYSPTCRAPPTSNYNPIHSPSYPPGAIKQAHPSSPMVKAKKGKAKPAPKPLAAIDVMKHQPYQLNSSLFTYGPAVEAAEAAKANAPKPEPAPAPHSQNQPIMYEQAVQPAGPMSAPYPNNPQQLYGMPPQPAMQDGAYHHAPPNAYQPPFNNPYQQVAAGPYQHPYNPPYPQAPSSSYQPQAQAQPSNPAYQQAPHDPYQPAHSPPYQSAPQVPYQPLPPSTYVVPSFPMAAKPESVSGGSTAPKPRFMAKKSSAQTFGRNYSLSPPAARAPSLNLWSSSGSPSHIPQARASSAPAAPGRLTSRLDRSHKPPSPWEAAARHPMGLVDEAFAQHDVQQTIASNVCLAAQRKLLPEPPAEWKARVSDSAPRKTETWNTSERQNRSQSYSRVIPHFLSPTMSTASAPAGPAGYRYLTREWQPQRSLMETNVRPPGASYGYRRALGE
ncbi:hypothetical protein DPEC_G00103090 [Dallia pectoralis]|uniref:Uncharacterized protein n=1 Tax=Dallia pectoralis TaxID=75939 RepID=A0ACC2GY67_DALPE|nr:hypothetical protein DPEC_G00103090 [Dallia pectoralis]